MLSRRTLLSGTAAAAAFAATGTSVRAQGKPVEGWPTRPVRVVSPAGPAGPSAHFRLYTEHLREHFGQPFTLENMPGGSGVIGAQHVLRANDAHTLVLPSNSAIVLAPLVIPDFPVNYTQFDPIALLYRFRFQLLVNHKLPVRTLAELVDYAKERPNELNFGSPGTGTGGHLVTELLVRRTGIKATHVPYKSTTQQMMDTAQGSLQFTFDTIGNARPMVEAGNLFPLAVTGPSRSEAAPDVPTLGELGYEGFENLFVTNGLMIPKGAGMPKGAIEAMAAEIGKLNSAGDIPKRLEALAYEVGTGTPEDYGASLEADHKMWSAIVKETGITVTP